MYLVAHRVPDLELEPLAAQFRLGIRLRLAQLGSDERGEEQIWLAGEDVTASIRTEKSGAGASAVAALGPVRSALLGLQRGFRHSHG